MRHRKNLANLILRAGAEPGAFRAVQNDIRESNKDNLINLSVLETTAMAVMLILSFAVSGLENQRSFYLVGLLSGLCVLIPIRFLSDKYPGIIGAVFYVFLATVFMAGISIGTFGAPDEITATYIALMLTGPQFIVDRPLKVYFLIAVSNIIFIILAHAVKNPLTWTSDTINSILFGVVSCILYTMTAQVKVSRFTLEEKIRYMAETDQLTGLKNRNSFEQTTSGKDMRSAKDLYCVYVDVNGLHELNNEEGHEAGDRMLKDIASAMQGIFGAENTYRVGGDEYVALGAELKPDEIEEKAGKLKADVQKAGYHIALGLSCESGEHIDVHKLVKSAEALMYEDKERYYIENGIDGSRRR